MNGPRFKVASVTGYAISDCGHGRSGRVVSTDYAVLDRAVCHRQVATFSGATRPVKVAERMAWELAEILNGGGTLAWYDTRAAKWKPAPPPPWFRHDHPGWPFL